MPFQTESTWAKQISYLFDEFRDLRTKVDSDIRNILHVLVMVAAWEIAIENVTILYPFSRSICSSRRTVPRVYRRTQSECVKWKKNTYLYCHWQEARRLLVAGRHVAPDPRRVTFRLWTTSSTPLPSQHLDTQEY